MCCTVLGDITLLCWEITGLTHELCYHSELITSYRLSLCLCFSFWGDGCIHVELLLSTGEEVTVDGSTDHGDKVSEWIAGW